MVGSILNRKLRRDLWQSRWQILGLLLITALGVFVFSGLDTSWRAMERAIDRYYEDQHFADLWVSRDRFAPEEVSAIASIDGVERVFARTTIEARAGLVHSPTLTVHVAESVPTVNELVAMDQAGSGAVEGDLYLEQAFADANGLRIGDEIRLNYDGQEAAFTIRELVQSPEYLLTTTAMVSDHEAYGFAWAIVDDGALAQLPVTEVTVTLEQGADIKAVRDEVLWRFPDAFVKSRELNTGHVSYEADIATVKGLSTMLPLLFVFVATLMVMTTMKRLVDTQRTNIGILDSLGYRRWQITLHYLAYALLPTAIGVFLGVLLGVYLLPPMLWGVYQEVYVLPEQDASSISWPVGAVAVGVVMIAVLVGYLALRDILRHRPAELLRPQSPRAGSTMILERWGRLWSSLGFNGKMVLQNLGRQRARTAMAFFGVLVCTSLIIASFGMLTSFLATIDSYYDDRLAYDVHVTLSPGQPLTADQLSSVRAERIDPVQETPVEVSAGDRTIVTSLFVLEPGQRSLDIGELPAQGVVLPEQMANELGVTPGGTMRLRAVGGEGTFEVRIGRLVSIPLSQGMYSADGYWTSVSGQPFMPTSIMIDGLSEEMSTDLAAKPWVDAVEYLAQQKENMLDLVGTLLSVILVLIGIALMLALVVLYTMGTMNFIERVREFATLKVLGYHQWEIRGLVVSESLIVSSVAAALGVPVGYVLTTWIIESGVSSNMTVATVVEWWVIAAATGLTVGFSWLVQVWIARRLREVDMVSALKSVE